MVRTLKITLISSFLILHNFNFSVIYQVGKLNRTIYLLFHIIVFKELAFKNLSSSFTLFLLKHTLEIILYGDMQIYLILSRSCMLFHFRAMI